ncbi:Uncharacterized protein HZ326_29017 [Fusarium oxysporum f. sp. albedinis]|nr:Uncharacterized protein HZ326_29017 [Fusarium oxysporum f. sp. albedinis]
MPYLNLFDQTINSSGGLWISSNFRTSLAYPLFQDFPEVFNRIEIRTVRRPASPGPQPALNFPTTFGACWGEERLWPNADKGTVERLRRSHVDSSPPSLRYLAREHLISTSLQTSFFCKENDVFFFCRISGIFTLYD